MRAFAVGGLLVLIAVLFSRTSWGVRVGNEARSLSDRCMLGLLRLTSDFEREGDGR
jgi:hypothetical protein